MLLSITFLPLINALITITFGRYLGSGGAIRLTIGGMLVNLILTLCMIIRNSYQEHLVFLKMDTWFSSSLLHVNWSLNFDNLTLTMFFVVNLISTLVHIYSAGYMSTDPHIPRFMSFLSLFTFFMLWLVGSDNLVALFLGWEGVGICSYLLIGFWYTRPQASRAAMKALIVNRVSDMFLLIGIMGLFWTFISINFPTIISLTPFMLSQEVEILEIRVDPLNIFSFFLMVGAMGKSAQIFLHTWLPDAMEGPTPVSALIHAATMVTAGVFLIIKTSPLFEYATTTSTILSIVGGLTALFSSTVGLVQTDMKKVIAYSTCSQLGYMMLACGLSAYNLALFHLMNHALFKALLFLSAGSVIHSLANEQDLRKMGGLTQLLPLAYSTMFIGSLALMGFPFLSGYYSKDLILELAYTQYNILGSWLHWLASLTAFFTACYSIRLLYLGFIRATQASKPVIKHIHEAPWLIYTPLILLAIGSISIGYATKDIFIGPGSPWLSHALLTHPEHNTVIAAEFLPWYIKNLPFLLTMASGLSITFIYTQLRYFGFMEIPELKDLHEFLISKWYFDTIYAKYIESPLSSFSTLLAWLQMDRGWIEKAGPRVLYRSVHDTSRGMHHTHTGIVFQYSTYTITIFLMLFFLFIAWNGTSITDGLYYYIEQFSLGLWDIIYRIAYPVIKRIADMFNGV